MGKRFFAYIGRKLKGPCTLEELKALDGFGPQTEVTEADQEEFWQPAKRVKALAGLFAAEPKPVSKAPPAASKPVPRGAGRAEAPATGRHLVCPRCGAGVPVEKGALRKKCPFCESSLTLGKRGAVLVAADCPSCGGTVEYPEDSSTAHCGYCDAYLLIMAAGRTYRFFVPPRVTREAAVSRASAAGIADAESKAVLRYVPYWRHTATAFYWNIGRKTESTMSFGADQMTSQELANMDGIVPGSFKVKERVREFRAKRIDRSIRACLEPAGFAALGGRISRMPLRPYDESAMKDGEVLRVVMRSNEASERIGSRAYAGMRDEEIDQEAEHGSLLKDRLSLVYVPLWSFDRPGDPLVLDGIDGQPVRSAPSLKELRGREPVEDHSVPPKCVQAQCARCGHKLRIEGFQAVFFCVDCQLAWRIEKDSLIAQTFRVAAPGKTLKKTTAHLPVWRMRVSLEWEGRKIADQKALRGLVPGISYTGAASDPDKPIYVFAPAWGNMVTPRMSRVAKRFTRKQPDLEFVEEKFDKVVRAVYGPEEARAMVLSVLLGVIHLRADLVHDLERAEIKIHEIELLLVPGSGAHTEFVEGCMGLAVRNTELKEARR